MKQIRKYLALNYFYYAIPCLFCVTYLLLIADFRTLQYLVNSLYANFFNVLMLACAIVAVPNFCRLVYYTKRVKDLPVDVQLQAAANERFGFAGGGKSSSTAVQAYFEAQDIQADTESNYNYMLANRERWIKNGQEYKLANFDRIEKSVKFWNDHPEYIPYLVSDLEITAPDGRKSMFFTRDHLEQKEWLPICFLLADEGGTLMPQDEYTDRPEKMVLFFRLIRQFGIRACICEQKKDGILINVRAVLGGTVLCLGQRNVLLPNLLLSIIAFFKRILPKTKNSPRLGLVIEKLQNFASCLGFRIWDQLFFRTMDFKEYVPPERIEIVCTNKLPFYYDDMAYAELYLAKDMEPKVIDQEGRPTPGTPMGDAMLNRCYQEEEKAKQAEQKQALEELKMKNSLKKEQLKEIELDKKTQQTETTTK